MCLPTLVSKTPVKLGSIISRDRYSGEAARCCCPLVNIAVVLRLLFPTQEQRPRTPRLYEYDLLPIRYRKARIHHIPLPRSSSTCFFCLLKLILDNSRTRLSLTPCNREPTASLPQL